MAFESEDLSIFCAVLFVFRMYYQNDGLEGLDLNGGRRHCPFGLFAVERCPFSHVALRIYSPNLASDFNRACRFVLFCLYSECITRMMA